MKNLSQLKKALVPGAEFEIIAHCRPECVGQIRKVNIANTQGIYSIIPNEPQSKVTNANCGKGSWNGWSKAPFWEVDGDTAALYDSDEIHTEEHLIIKIRVVCVSDEVTDLSDAPQYIKEQIIANAERLEEKERKF